MNKCIFVTRLTRDPEVRYSQAETPMAISRFNGAVDRRVKTQDQTADFINFLAFGKIAEFIEKYCVKGTKLIIESHVQTGSYTNKDGVKVYTTDFVIDQVEFAESKRQDSENTGSNAGSQQASGSDGFMNIPSDLDSEDLPFN